jgi:hypothetical protein
MNIRCWDREQALRRLMPCRLVVLLNCVSAILPSRRRHPSTMAVGDTPRLRGAVAAFRGRHRNLHIGDDITVASSHV